MTTPHTAEIRERTDTPGIFDLFVNDVSMYSYIVGRPAAERAREGWQLGLDLHALREQEHNANLTARYLRGEERTRPLRKRSIAIP